MGEGRQRCRQEASKGSKLSSVSFLLNIFDNSTSADVF